MTENELIARLNRLEEIQHAHQEMHRGTVAVLRSFLEQMTTPAKNVSDDSAGTEIRELERLLGLEPPEAAGEGE